MANPLLDVQHLSKAIGDLVLFSDISFSIAERQKVGLIARNGAGKTSLLDILCGDEDYGEGRIVTRRDLRIGYLPQQPEFPGAATVLEACFTHAANPVAQLIKAYEQCLATPGNPGLAELVEQMDSAGAWDYEARIKQILTVLKITDFQQPVGQLSGGQIKRIALANVLMMEPDLLVLDEPTNHLDLQMIEWLENYLSQGTFALLMVTHDRYFLDRVCSEILELDEQTIYAYQGNYAYYLEKREQRLAVRSAEIQRANNLYRKELDWMRRMPCARGHKARYRQEAFYELEKVARRRMEERRAALQVKSAYIGHKIFEAQYISKAFGDTVILKDFYYNFARFEKLGIVGNNGTGKSTFVKLLLGHERPDAGRISVGETVRFGYFSQEGMTFNEGQKVIDAVRDIAEYVDLGGGRKLTASQFLQYFLFPPSVQHNYIAKLSGGERRRLYLCTVLMQAPNFLILDEPTNDLDIATLQVLEEFLLAFHGCVIIVSHDRYFMDKVVDHVLVFRGQGEIKDFPGNYSQFREWEDARLQTEREEQAQLKAKAPKTAAVAPQQTHARKLTFKERRELETLEPEIAALEEEKQRIEAELSSGTLTAEQITAHAKRLPVLTDEIDAKTLRWLELSELAG